MGWYTLGSAPSEADLKLHEQVTNAHKRQSETEIVTCALKFLQVSESALFLQMDPMALQASGAAKEFPVDIYESIIDIVEGNTRLVFIKSTYKVETGEAECIAVDHVAKPSSSSADTGLGNTCKCSVGLITDDKMTYLQCGSSDCSFDHTEKCDCHVERQNSVPPPISSGHSVWCHTR